MKLTRKSCLAVLFVKVWVLLSSCLTILLVMPFVYAQETQTVLKPNQLVTFSLAPEQEKSFLLQMKKGDFAEFQSPDDIWDVSFEIYDSARTELLEKSDEIWFVAPSDGDFLLVSKLAKSDEISDAQKISIQYNNKLVLPRGTKLKGIRKVNGFDVKIMNTPESVSADGVTADSILIIEKKGQLQYAKKGEMQRDEGFSFFEDNSAELTRQLKTTRDKASRTYLIDELKRIQLINSTPDKTGNGIPDIMIDYWSGVGAHCCILSYFFDLGDTVKLSDWINRGGNDGWAITKNPKGGLLFTLGDDFPFAYWLTSFAQSPKPTVILEFRNGKLRPNFDLMKKPPPSLAELKKNAQVQRQQLNLEPYRGEKSENCRRNGFINMDGKMEYFFEPCLYKEDASVPVFWGVMLDLIYSGNEELAWQFLDLVWSPQKQGKELFIRDFKKQLLESEYWQMILEDQKK